MGTKLDIILFNTIGPFHWSGQHVAAIATDTNTERTFNINWISPYTMECGFAWGTKLPSGTDEKFRNCYIYLHNMRELYYVDHDGKREVVSLTDFDKFEEGVEKMKRQHYCSINDVKKFITSNGGHVPVSKAFTTRAGTEYNDLTKQIGNRCCIGITTLYSDHDFDAFVEYINSEYSNLDKYSYFSKNCATVISDAIDKLCPRKAYIDTSFWIYQAACFPFFVGTLGLSCFPAPPCFCKTPQDIYNKAKWLAAMTSYGCETTASIEVNEIKSSTYEPTEVQESRQLITDKGKRRSYLTI